MSWPAVSQQLQVLLWASLVRAEPLKPEVFYPQRRSWRAGDCDAIVTFELETVFGAGGGGVLLKTRQATNNDPASHGQVGLPHRHLAGFDGQGNAHR